MIKYIDTGGEDKKVLLLLHGLGQRKESWKRQYELSDTYRLIIPDLMGHGSNDLPNKPITLENMAVEVIELLENLNVNSCYIIGLSLGGLLAQEIFRQKESLVNSLILSNTTWYIPTYFANKIVNKSEKLFYEDKEQLIEHIVNTAIHNKDIYEEAKQSFYLSDVYLDAAVSGSGYNYFPTLLRVNVPTLLIGGRFDNTIPLYNLFLMKWMVPIASIEIMECGHLSNIECPEQFNQAIREFVA